MGIFATLKRAAGRGRAVRADLKRLEQLKHGTAEKAINYVLDGSDETVLATISNFATGKELEVGELYVGQQSKTPGRRRMLAHQNPFDTEFSRRYSEVLLASCSNLPDSAAGSDKVPPLMRVFFSEAFQGIIENTGRWPRKADKLSAETLSLPIIIHIADVLGGDIADLVDVLYHAHSQWGCIDGTLYRSVVNLSSLFEENVEACVEGARRLHASSRVEILRDLHKFGLLDKPEYQDYLLDMAGDSAKMAREAAGGILMSTRSPNLQQNAVERLEKGNVNMRAGMVEYLAKLGSEDALDMLRAHREKEKTARVVAAIDTALAVSEQAHAGETEKDDETSYQGLDGERIDIPRSKPLQSGDPVVFGRAEKAELAELIVQENELIKRQNAERKKTPYKWQAPLIDTRLSDKLVAALNSPASVSGDKIDGIVGFVSWGVGGKWLGKYVSRMPQDQALELSVRFTTHLNDVFSSWSRGPFSEHMKNFLNGPDGDIRHIERLGIAAGPQVQVRYGYHEVSRTIKRGDLLRSLLRESYSYYLDRIDAMPSRALWPYIAESLAVVDEAFGLGASDNEHMSKLAAIRALQRLPSTPARYFRPLLDIATGTTKAGRAEARDLLQVAPRVEEHIIALLDDSRQAIRAGAAEWLEERGATDAIPALQKRLAKEKSELAKAAMLTTLKRLGVDLSDQFTPDILLDEAVVGLKKAKLDKLEWLALDHLPAVHFNSGTRVPDEVIKWWLYLAVKLKQPGGNALFDNYLEQLSPESAEQLSMWVLDSWLNYDTARPSDEDGNAHANANAKSHLDMMKRWYKEFTLEMAFEALKRNFMSQYLNSGAATKGLLGLAKHATPAVAADRVRHYLKNHGSRTSQSSALLEMLAGAGDPVSLQVIISAATRLKQKGVQKFAGSLVEQVAESKHWSMDELGDRTIPSAGLDEAGVLELPCGPDGKMYTARLDESLLLVIRNPDGKVVKSLPSGPDDTTKASKKSLSSSRKELKQVVAMQTARLYEALCSARQWSKEDWSQDLYGHPVMRKLVERVVWTGLDESGQVVATFRPTAEGDYTDASDEDVDLAAFASIGIAYGAGMEASIGDAWAVHLKDYEISPLFTQFGRSMLTLADDAGDAIAIEDRKGWLTDTFTFRGAATKLGYERGEAMDGGYFNEYTKGFLSAGVIAVIEFSGNCLPEENVPAAMMSLSFEKYTAGRRTGTAMKLVDVPPVLLSECWNDYRAAVAKAAFDEKWEKKMPWM